jgi:hypothetical protein
MSSSPGDSHNVIQGSVVPSEIQRSPNPLYEATVRRSGIDPTVLFTNGKTSGCPCEWEGHSTYGI